MTALKPWNVGVDSSKGMFLKCVWLLVSENNVLDVADFRSQWNGY